MALYFNRTVGATFFVAGTSIGAGMLALPMASLNVGYTHSLMLMVGMWALMYVASLIILELNLATGGMSLPTIFESALGPLGKHLAAMAFLVLHGALLAAYVTGGGTLLKGFIGSVFDKDIPFGLTSVGFLAVFGFIIYACVSLTDYTNRLLFMIKACVFVGMLACLFPAVEGVNLQSHSSGFDSLWVVVPVFFASFGFHGSLPSLTNYLGSNTSALRKALLWGSLIPLGVYIAWQTATLGVLTLPEQAWLAPEADVAHFIQKLVSSAGGGTLLSTLANVFAFLAIATSFLGVGLALFDYLSEQLPTCPINVPCRLRSALLTFGPPLAFALFYPQGFIVALEFAGVALALLAVVLPSLCAILMRGRYPAGAYKAPVPTWLLGVLILMGVLVIGIELKKVLF